MANITMAKSTSRPICRSGAIALIIDLSTTWRPVWKKFDRSNSGPTTAPSKRLFTLFLLVSRLFTFPRCSGKRACRTVFSFSFIFFFSRSEAPETKSTRSTIVFKQRRLYYRYEDPQRLNNWDTSFLLHGHSIQLSKDIAIWVVLRKTK